MIRSSGHIILELGGGSLLDIGIYPVMDILRYMGEPETILASSVLSPTGADESTSVIFKFSDGRLAEAHSSFSSMAGVSTEFNCEKGNLILSRGRDRRSIFSSNFRMTRKTGFSPRLPRVISMRPWR